MLVLVVVKILSATVVVWPGMRRGNLNSTGRMCIARHQRKAMSRPVIRHPVSNLLLILWACETRLVRRRRLGDPNVGDG